MLALENFVEPSHTAAWNWLPLHFSMKENKPPSCLSYYFECLCFMQPNLTLMQRSNVLKFIQTIICYVAKHQVLTDISGSHIVRQNHRTFYNRFLSMSRSEILLCPFVCFNTNTHFQKPNYSKVFFLPSPILCPLLYFCASQALI